MKRKVLSTLLAATMLTGLLAGCGNSSEPAANNNSEPAAENPAPAETTPAVDSANAETQAPAVEVGDVGCVLNFYWLNVDFYRRIRDHYPNYEVIDSTHGTIGDVSVVWNITPNDDNAYQNNLDETLLRQADAATDDKIDLFLVEADYALKYVDTEYTMPVKDLALQMRIWQTSISIQRTLLRIPAVF